MRQLKSLDEAMETLLAYSPLHMKGSYNLERTEQILQLIGNPQEQFKSVHIAGTSGKTSTAYFIRGMLQAKGQRTGLTVSPHITAINERVQIDGTPLESEKFLVYLNDFLDIIDQSELHPTYFELLIAFAYWVFAKEKVDYAVIETGLGGLLDSTNTIRREDKVCVISDIGLDHTEILGNTTTKIAVQKAGIIQAKNHVIVQNQDKEILDVIKEAAKKKKATLETVKFTMTPSALPEFQRRNFSLALAAFHYVRKRDDLEELSYTELDEVAHETPPGRFEVYAWNDKTIILDGAHNPQKMEMLYQTFSLKYSEPAAVLANIVEAPDTKIFSTLAILQPLASYLIIPSFYAGQDLKSRHSVESGKTEELARKLDYPGVEQQPDIGKAVQALLERPEKILLITGSLYLVSLARPYIQKLL
ncbi:MAG TPA: Mur ligase family protein [Candidatus Saccharimonadales bacterium]|nr:Mur ligase family protein [Candidatus Saccharimonadales bacterium]